MRKMEQLYTQYKDFIMEVLHFGIVGVVNTLMGWLIMFLLYNLVHLNYWLSSAISYLIGGIYSYHANSRVTFKVEERDRWLPWRFAVNVIVCYLAAYSVAQPLVKYVLSSQPKVIVDNIAMVVGTGLYIIMNFFGQKFLVFRKRNIKTQEDRGEEKVE